MNTTPFKYDKNASEYPIYSEAAKLRYKIDNEIKLSENEKLWLTKHCIFVSYDCKIGIFVSGWVIPFEDVMKLYYFETRDGRKDNKYAINKTMLRKSTYGTIIKIEEIKE